MFKKVTPSNMFGLKKRRAEIEKDLKMLQELEKHRAFRRYREELKKMGRPVVYSKDIKETLKFYDEQIQEIQKHYNDINIANEKIYPGWNTSKTFKKETPLNLKDIKEHLKGLDAELQDMKDRDVINYGMNFSWHSPVATQDGFLKRAIRRLFQRER